MAGCDYKNCDVCGNKVFYDVELNYDEYDKEYISKLYHSEFDPVKEVGEVPRWKYSLQRLGDWAVLCQACSKTHKCVILPCIWEFHP